MDCRKKTPEVRVSFIEHTADVGIEAYAPDKKTLLEACACSLLNLITDTETVNPVENFSLKLGPFTDDEDMLFEFLNEIIYLIDAKGVLFCDVEVTGLTDLLEANLKGEKMDPERHVIKEQVKAATYHQLTFRRQEDGWFARVIFDV